MADLTGQSIKIPVIPRSIEVPIMNMAKDMTIEVKLTGYRRWHLRLRVGIWLMRLAVWVAGMGFKVEDIGQ